MIDRRYVIAGSAASLLPIRITAAARRQMPLVEALEQDLHHYDRLGVHRTGSPADRATSAWLQSGLRALGYSVAAPSFEAEIFVSRRSTIVVGDGTRLPILVQEPVPSRPLALAGVLAPTEGEASLTGKIALARFPYTPDASFDRAPYPELARAAARRGAIALIAITEGPTGEIIALNTPRDGTAMPLPVFLAGPSHAAMLDVGTSVTVDVAGTTQRLRATNTIATLDRPAQTIVVSTPQSAWTHAAGERGPGIAIWRHLARWAAQPGRNMRYVFVATSGHEIAHAGLSSILETKSLNLGNGLACWLHLGANLATFDRDRSTSTGFALSKVANATRGGGASPAILAKARAAFAALPDFKIQLADGAAAFGEAKQILGAGYAPVLGLVGSGVLHHTPLDRAGYATSGALVASVAQALVAFLESIDRAS